MNSLLRDETREEESLSAIRTFLLVIFFLGLLGIGGELLLVGHTEEIWQFTPLVLIVASLAVLGGYAVERGPRSMRAFQGIMVLFMVSGCAGLWFHYRANVEIELEMYRTLRGTALFWKAIKGSTPPTLAPGVMIQLGLLGLVYTYRHPSFEPRNLKKSNDGGE